MLEVCGDIWELGAGHPIVITVNGALRRDGACVMGRGVALQAKARYPGIEYALGGEIRRRGNHVHRLVSVEGDVLYSFPVKHHWREQADLDLIRRSVEELSMAGEHVIFLPRPGCGNGGRSWSEVRPLLADALSDRFVVVEMIRPPVEGMV